MDKGTRRITKVQHIACQIHLPSKHNFRSTRKEQSSNWLHVDADHREREREREITCHFFSVFYHFPGTMVPQLTKYMFESTVSLTKSWSLCDLFWRCKL